MRMWMVPPHLLCRKHLLGEHVEMHMFGGSVEKGIRMDGYIQGGLLDPSQLAQRHDALAAEMIARGYRHMSPLPESWSTTMASRYKAEEVSVESNLNELSRRCVECRKNIHEFRTSSGIAA